MKKINYIDPRTQEVLRETESGLIGDSGKVYPFVKGAYRLVSDDNYAQNFGFQWHKFQKVQLDHTNGTNLTKDRFFKSTGWDKEDLTGKSMLEVGCGAGRFTEVVINHTQADLYSLDYSSAVEVNHLNNGHSERLKLFQASVYEMPFEDNSFDKVFCFGVLQHTPDFKKSVHALIDKVKPGGEIVVDFYPIKGWWTKLNAKYFLRPWTKKMSDEELLKLIDRHVDTCIRLYNLLYTLKLGVFTRFIPICDIRNTIPDGLTDKELRDWVVLDTFDMFSPAFDNPQKISTVVKWFEQRGLKNVKGEMIQYNSDLYAAVVKGVK